MRKIAKIAKLKNEKPGGGITQDRGLAKRDSLKGLDGRDRPRSEPGGLEKFFRKSEKREIRKRKINRENCKKDSKIRKTCQNRKFPKTKTWRAELFKTGVGERGAL